MILPDSSAWIEEYRGTGSAVHRALSRALQEDRPIAITEPVVMELLAGATTARELRAIRSRLLAFPMLRVGGLDTYERAAMVWRTCRAAGEQLRNTVDCVIAAVAIREGVAVLHADRDFDIIARHTPLQVELPR